MKIFLKIIDFVLYLLSAAALFWYLANHLIPFIEYGEIPADSPPEEQEEVLEFTREDVVQMKFNDRGSGLENHCF